MSSPYALSIAEASREIRARRLSPVEVVESVLGRIAELEGTIQAFVELDPDAAMAAARSAEASIAAGAYRGPLHGIPVAAKDIFDVTGFGTGAGTPAFPRTRPGEDAASVARLRDAGAIVLGKTHTHELALGVMTPPTRNPWDSDRSSGGSSGGSAAAVAAGEVFAALGSDTGGSIRGPASVCGVVGLKPTYGRVSRHGIVANSWSLDTAGPLTRTVHDAALLLDVLAGFDPRDRSTLDVASPDYASDLERGVEGLTIGVPSSYYFDRVEPDVAAAVTRAVAAMEAEGARLRALEIPLSGLYDATIRGIQLPEISAYHEALLRERGDLLSPDMRATLLAASLAPARGYVRAQQIRERIRRAWKTMFEGIDVLVAPTHPAGAPRTEDEVYTWDDGLAEPVWSTYSRLTLPANLVGLPAVSVPCGLVAGRLPCGLQVIGRPFDEARMLQVAAAAERLSRSSAARSGSGDTSALPMP